jgi:hypothetical protein
MAHVRSILGQGSRIMCHGYEMKWTKSEMTAKKIKETARQEEKIKRISEEK